MRKAIFFLLLLIPATPIFAQEPEIKNTKVLQYNNEITAGYGYFTREYMLNFGQTSLVYIVNDSNSYHLPALMAYKLFGSYEAVHFGSRRRTGVMCVSYKRTVLPWLSISLTAGFENETQDLTYGYGAIGKYSRSCFSLAPECQLIYKHKSIVTYYGFLGIGNAFITGKYTSNTSTATEIYHANYINPQITPFGIKAGKRLSGFGEVGFGYKGVLHLGMGYTF